MITVIFLSCKRTNLTKKTIYSLINLNPEFKNFKWICFDNICGNKANIEYLESLEFVDFILQSRENQGIAKSTSILTDLSLFFAEENPYTLYLQNDWECIQSSWLEPCIETLKHFPNAFIKLSTKTGKMYNTFTRIPFIYLDSEHCNTKRFKFKLIENGHFSLNPFLIQTKHLSKIFPATKEKHAQERFNVTNLKRIDMPPECAPFQHIGMGTKRTKNWIR